MSESSVETVDDPNQLDSETLFLRKYIMKWDEFNVLNNDRISVNEKINKKVITKRELLLQFKVELTLFNTCKLKIKDELEKTDDVINTQILVLLYRRVIFLFDVMYVRFSIEEDLLSYYIDVCQDNVSCIQVEQLQILLQAVLNTKKNPKIWMQLLKLYLSLNNVEKLVHVFEKGVNALEEDSLPLWKILIRHLRYKRPDVVQHLLIDGLNISYENISFYIRPKYLEWCIEFKGIDATRSLFNELKKLQPACCKLYLMMIAIECEEPDFELDTVRKFYDDACTMFGKNNVEVWIDYMRFEYTYGTQQFKHRIFMKGFWKLESRSLRDTFVDEYKNLDREFWKALGKEVIVIDD